jgi:hypothetical protein
LRKREKLEICGINFDSNTSQTKYLFEKEKTTMKKFVSLGLASVLALSMAAPSFAFNGFVDNNAVADVKTSDITAKYTSSESYVMDIPVDMTLEATDAGASKDQEIKATKVILQTGHKLVVSVASENNYKLQYSYGQGASDVSAIAYTLSTDGGSSFTANASEGLTNDILTVNAGTTAGGTTGSEKVTISTTTAQIANATQAGDHTDTLTFTTEIADA